MMDRVPAEKLIAGDVLLYHGSGWISKAIRFFDGTDVNHAAIYLGNQSVGEAREFQGLIRQPLSESIAATDWVLARRLQPAPPSIDPVLVRAHAYLDNGNRYSYEQVFLLALLCLTRKAMISPLFARLVRAVLDKAALYYSQIAAGVTGGEPMICSEFVFRSYDEADPRPDDPYTIRIGDRPTGKYWLHAIPIAIAAGTIPRESLLGVLLRKSAMTQAPALPLEKCFLAVRRKTLRQSELDSVISQYLEAESQEPPTTGDELNQDSDLVELQDAVHNLALCVYEAAGHQVDRDLLATHPYSIRSPSFSHFLQIAADFITPGDLRKTPSLSTMGTLQ